MFGSVLGMRLVKRWFCEADRRYIYLRTDGVAWRLTATEGDEGPWDLAFTTETDAYAFAAVMMAWSGGFWERVPR